MRLLKAYEDGIACRVCGAARGAPEPDAPKDVCRSCWRLFLYSLNDGSKKRPTLTDFNQWLARYVILRAKWLKQYGMLGRCEAISIGAYKDGYQCTRPARFMRDNHKVCASHNRPDCKPIYLSESGKDPYTMLRDLMIEVSALDADFARAVCEASAIVEENNATAA